MHEEEEASHYLDLCHVVMESPVVDKLQDDPQTLGCLVQFVHTHYMSMSYTLHDLNLFIGRTRRVGIECVLVSGRQC